MLALSDDDRAERSRLRRLDAWRRWVPLVAILFAVLAVEITMRVLEARAALGSLEIPDERRGWALRPGFRGWSDLEGRVWVEINRYGMRDRDHELTPTGGTVRVAVLGDSFMQGLNVPMEKTFPSFLERRLSGCGSRPIEALNFGVTGYGTAQELITYRDHVSRFRPDIVLLAIYTGNDIFNNQRKLNAHTDIPYFVLRDERLELEERPADPPGERLPWYQAIRLQVTDRLLTARAAWDAYALLRAPFVAPQLVEVPGFDGGAAEWKRLLYSPLSTGPIMQAWAVTEAMISTLAREATAAGAEFWVVTLSNSEQVDPDVARRRAFAGLLGVDDLFYPDRRLHDYAVAQGIPVISLAEPLAAYTAEHGVFLNGGYDDEFPGGTGHWNETANQLAADRVGERLCRASRAIATR